MVVDLDFSNDMIASLVCDRGLNEETCIRLRLPSKSELVRYAHPTAALGEKRLLKHIPSNLRHRPPRRLGRHRSAKHAHSNISRRTYATARRGVSAGIARRNTLTQTYPVEPTPPPAEASRPASLCETRSLKHIPSNLRHTARRGVSAGIARRNTLT